MRGALTVGAVAAGVALLLPAEPAISSPSQADASGARCRYVVKKVRGHKKRVRICKPKPKPKPAPKPQADLSVTVSSSLPRITAGNQVFYNVGLRNLGPEPAKQIEVSIEFPFGIEAEPNGAFIGDSGVSDISCEGSTSAEGAPFVWRCTIGELQPAMTGGEAGEPSVQLSYLVETVQAGPFAVTAQAKATTRDPKPENNHASASIDVLPGPASADLAIVVDAAPNPATVLGDFVETIKVKNNGPAEATSVRASMLLPLGAEVVDVQTDTFTAQCPSISGSSTTTLCWDVIQPGATVAAKIVLAPSGAAQPTLETNVAISAHTPDPDLTNNRVTSVTPLTPFHPGPGIDLVALLSPPRVVTPSEGERYAVFPFGVGNRGSDEALGTRATLSMSGPVTNAGVAFTSTSGGLLAAGCQPSDSMSFDCVVRSAKSGGRVSGLFFGELTGAGEVRVTLTVVPVTADAQPADNKATATLQAG